MSYLRQTWLAEIERIIQQELDHQYESGKRDGQPESEGATLDDAVKTSRILLDAVDSIRAFNEGKFGRQPKSEGVALGVDELLEDEREYGIKIGRKQMREELENEGVVVTDAHIAAMCKDRTLVQRFRELSCYCPCDDCSAFAKKYGLNNIRGEE